ncbi:MAG: transporter [Myxococcota bacterium]
MMKRGMTRSFGYGRFGRAGLVMIAGLALVLGWVVNASADTHPAGHAPIGVMGDHTHEKGEFMLSYRYMIMGMKGLRDGDERISRRKVLQDFSATPTSMEMQMHMFGAMYSPIDRLTLMLMVPYVRTEMDHRTAMVTPIGTHFTTKSDGLGDIRLSGMIDLIKEEKRKVHLTLGVSFPTGSITQQDQTPMSMGNQVRIPYPMQIGSGTYDFLPALTYNGNSGHDGVWSWGGQARGEIRMNENHAGYRLGDEYALTGWLARTFTRQVSGSLRLEWQHNLNVRGREESPSVNPAIIPTADPDRRAVQRLDLLFGVNFVPPWVQVEGLRLAVEAGLPIYQHLDGPGLETDVIATAGVQYAF